MVRVTMKKEFGLLGMIVLILIPGCFLNRPLTIDPGEYMLSKNSAGDEGFNGPAIKMLQVNSQKSALTVFFRNGDYLPIPYSIRPLTGWPKGCPGNLYSQKMEVIDLELDESAAAVLGMDTPILVRNCPADPYELVLREDGEIGGPSTACPYPASCLFFKPKSK